MKTNPLTTALAALIAAGLLLGSTAVGPAQQFSECLSNRQVQNAVSDGQILSLGKVLRRAGFGDNWTTVSAEVCDAGGQLVYVVSLRQGNQVTEAVLDANTGDPL